jgi:hypothetical protein
MTTVIISMTRKRAAVQRVLVIILLEVATYADAHMGTGNFLPKRQKVLLSRSSSGCSKQGCP